MPDDDRLIYESIYNINSERFRVLVRAASGGRVSAVVVRQRTGRRFGVSGATLAEAEDAARRLAERVAIRPESGEI